VRPVDQAASNFDVVARHRASRHTRVERSRTPPEPASLQAKKRAFALLNELQKEGIGVRAALSKDSLRSQLRLANKFKVKLTLILGQKEVQDKTIIVRDMKEGIQEIVSLDKATEYIKTKLK
jgi:histidyl-tRNA synthetase